MSRTYNIVLVEDNPADVFLMRETLNEAGINHELTVLEDGEEAIDFISNVAETRQLQPDLIILDLNMPKRNGHEVLAEIRANSYFIEMPVVVLTTSENPEDKRRILEHGATYVTKPANLENFFRVLETVEIATCDIASRQGEMDAKQARQMLAPELIKILIVEDNPTDVLYLEETLKDTNLPDYEIVSVEDLESAVSLLKVQTINVILADLGLPDMNGLDVVSVLQGAAPSVPLVILTGLDDEKIADDAVELGAQDYLVKGQFDSRTLVRSIRYAVTRKRAEEFALRAVSYENVVLQEILEHSPIGIARFAPDLTVVNCNSVFAFLIQSDRASVVGESISLAVPLPDTTLWNQTVRKGLPFRLQECPVKRKSNGEDIFLDLTVWPIRSRDNDTKGGIILALDVSDRVKLERQRDDFTASLAHDIKNPLLGADRVLSILTNTQLSPEQHGSMVSMLKQSNTNVLVMLQNLLDIYRYDSASVTVNLEKLFLGQPIADAVSLTALSAYDKNVKIDVRLPQDLPAIRADALAVQRLFCNLLDNAVRFSERDSTVTLTAFEDTNDHVIVVEVTDTGSGMTDEELGVMFKRFGESRASKYKGGTGSGLGLYLCKQIVDANRGTIVCTSKPGAGAKFTIRFPEFQTEKLQEVGTAV